MLDIKLERWKEILFDILKIIKTSQELDLPDNLDDYYLTLSRKERDEMREVIE